MNERKLPMIVLALIVSVLLVGFSRVARAETPVDWNIRTNPLGLILGPNLRLEYKVSEHVTVGPEVALIYLNLGGVKANGFSGGVLASYYFNEVYVNSWIAEAGVSYGTIDASATDSYGNVDSASAKNFSVLARGGYHWFWDRFNLAVSLGLATNSAGSTDIVDQNGTKVKSLPYHSVNASGDASLGWTF